MLRGSEAQRGCVASSEPSPRKPENPVFWIVAGPNGCGKSTFYNRTDIEGWGGSVWIINPDLLARRIADQEGEDIQTANRFAVERMEVWLASSIEVHQTIGVETVLSTGKYRRLVKKAQLRGFEVRLVYVFVRDLAEQNRRIVARELAGGHHVPPEKVASRRERSFGQLAWFLRKCDTAYVFDNSGSKMKMAVQKPRGQTCKKLTRLPDDMTQILQEHGLLLT